MLTPLFAFSQEPVRAPAAPRSFLSAQRQPIRETAPSENLFLGDELREPAGLDLYENDPGSSMAVPLVDALGESAAPSRLWKAVPHLQFGAAYDSNIFIQPENQQADQILTAAPGLTLGYGDCETTERWLPVRSSEALLQKGDHNWMWADYTINIVRFLHHENQSSLNHDGRFELQWTSASLTLGAQFHAESKSETNTEAGARIRRKAFTSAVSSNLILTDKSVLEATLLDSREILIGYSEVHELRGNAILGYQITPLLRLGAGIGAGQIWAAENADQHYWQVLAQARYVGFGKFSGQISGGLEFRRSDALEGAIINPVVDLRVDWSPREETIITLAASHRVGTSAVTANESFTQTTVSLGVVHRLNDRFSLTAAARFERTRFDPMEPSATRQDNLTFGRGSLVYELNSWAAAEFAYEMRNNRSSDPESSFVDKIISVSLGLRY